MNESCHAIERKGDALNHISREIHDDSDEINVHDAFAQQTREGFALGRLAVKRAQCAIQRDSEEKREEEVNHGDITDV